LLQTYSPPALSAAYIFTSRYSNPCSLLLAIFFKKIHWNVLCLRIYLRLVIVMDYLTLGLLFIIYRKPYSCKKTRSYRSFSFFLIYSLSRSLRHVAVYHSILDLFNLISIKLFSILDLLTFAFNLLEFGLLTFASNLWEHRPHWSCPTSALFYLRIIIFILKRKIIYV